MSQLLPIALLSAISVILFLIGIWLGKKALYISIGGALIMIVVGVTLFASPVTTATGTEAYLNLTTNTTITNNIYTPINTFQNNILATVLSLVGIAGIVVPATMLNKEEDEE